MIHQKSVKIHFKIDTHEFCKLAITCHCTMTCCRMMYCTCGETPKNIVKQDVDAQLYFRYSSVYVYAIQCVAFRRWEVTNFRLTSQFAKRKHPSWSCSSSVSCYVTWCRSWSLDFSAAPRDWSCRNARTIHNASSNGRATVGRKWDAIEFAAALHGGILHGLAVLNVYFYGALKVVLFWDVEFVANRAKVEV